MRNFILTIIAAVLAVGCAPKSDAVLVFNVKNPTAREVVVVCHNAIHTAALDENGSAELVMTGMDAAYAKVFYGRHFRTIFFEKGDTPVISFDGRNFKDTFVFEGEKSPMLYASYFGEENDISVEETHIDCGGMGNEEDIITFDACALLEKSEEGTINELVEISNLINKFKIDKKIDSKKYPRMLELNDLTIFKEEEMESLDNGLAIARKEYNTMAFRYNEKANSFPMNKLATSFKLNKQYKICHFHILVIIEILQPQ